MSLYIDGPPASMEDLSAQDSQLLDIAAVEGISVTEKLRQSWEEIGLELYGLLNRLKPTGVRLWSAIKPNLAAVVVTPPLKRWHVHRALEAFYADAYNSQLNDRYAGKREQFHGLAKDAYNLLLDAGLGMVYAPIPRPERPVVSALAGDLPDGLYYATMSWVNGEGDEGEPAAPSSIMTTSSTFLVTPAGAPSGVSGWNVYVGSDLQLLMRQNLLPLATSSTWVQPDAILTIGPKAGQGQRPAYHQPVPRLLRRG